MPSEALVTASTLSNLNINFESEFDYEYTLNYLSSNGYVRVSSIREPGEFSVKGDVIDIFPSEFAKRMSFTGLYSSEWYHSNAFS